MLTKNVRPQTTENLTYEEYTSIESYIVFMVENSPTSEELAIIKSLLNNGTAIQTISEIYDFYVTTSESPEIISQIASLEESYWGDNWIENAYNKIVDEKHGVLRINDIKIYLENGLSLEDISFANILCRKGVYTINEILQMKENGTTWDDITNSIYSSVTKTANLAKSAKSENTMSILSNSVVSFDDNPLAVYELNKAMSGIDNDILLKSINSDNLEDTISRLENLQSKAVVSMVDSVMKKLNLPSNFMNRQQLIEYEKSNCEIIASCGIDDKTVERLKKRGFSAGEIATASDTYDGNPLRFLEELKSRREA